MWIYDINIYREIDVGYNDNIWLDIQLHCGILKVKDKVINIGQYVITYQLIYYGY